MQDKILEFLKKKQAYISGEEISGALKISRQALWKHIHELKDLGYDIEAVPHLGYRLLGVPDRLFASEITFKLNTAFVGRKVYYFDETHSTMDVAFRLGEEGCAEGALVVAETQAKGRGRLGRSWISPKYKGIYATLILRPDIPLAQASILTLLAAVGICEAIKEITVLEPAIKWPNDILLGNKKIGGILLELSAQIDAVRFVTIGMGLNVNNDKNSLPSGATSLKEQKGSSVNRLELLRHILRRIEANYLMMRKKGNEAVIAKWRDQAVTLGRRVRILRREGELQGEALDIDKDGGLLLRKDSGLIEKVMSGDVVHSR